MNAATQCQQHELYAAERSTPSGKPFASLEDIQRFADDLRETWWWEQFYWMVSRVEVGPARRNGNASVGWYDSPKAAGRIEMLPVHWNEKYVLHELAHVLASARFESQAHDPYFARVYLELVYHVMGIDAWLELKTAFDAADINYDERIV